MRDEEHHVHDLVAAYMLGARIIEKHFTLNRAMRGTDHRFSLEPVGMKKMIRDLQRCRMQRRIHETVANPRNRA